MRARKGPGNRILLLALMAALGVVAAAMASGSAIPVTLAVGSSSADAGKPVALTATAKLPAGHRLLIQATHVGGKTLKVKECLRSPCRATWTEAGDADVLFQALVIKRAGTNVTILGRSKKIDVAWVSRSEPVGPLTPPAPPAPPPPPAVAGGHYEGKTSQNELFAFDVTADGTRITGLQTGQINQSCDPPDYYLSGGYLHDFSGSIQRDGSFAFGYNGPGTVGGNPATFKITITGHFATGSASGTIRDDVSWAQNGRSYTCSSGDQTWSVTKTG